MSGIGVVLRQLSSIAKSVFIPAQGGLGHGTARLASFGLTGVLILLSVFASWGALTSYRAGNAAKHFGVLSDAFEGARAAVASEESLERKYRLEPSVEVRGRHRAASDELEREFARARAEGEPGDAVLIDKILALHKEYLLAIDRMFSAVDAGDTRLANEIDGNEVDPRFDAMEAQVVAAANAHHAEAFRRLDDLAYVQTSVLIATPFVFVVGVMLVGFFSRVVRAQQRREEQSKKDEAIAVKRSETRYRALVQNSSDMVLICDAAGTITYRSPNVGTAWGRAADSLLGSSLSTAVHPDDRPAFENLLEQLQVAPGSTRGTELRLRDGDDSWHSVELILSNLLNDPDVAGMVLTARDIAQRKAFEEQLIQQAFHDPLTLLPNRALFTDRLEQANVRSARRLGSVGVLFVDLDNFKLINDGFGHQAGDGLLIEVATRLKACVRAEDTVARMGGDEFVILMELATEPEAVQTAERIEQQFAHPFKIDGSEVVVTVSIGIALGDASQVQSDVLLRKGRCRDVPREKRWPSSPRCFPCKHAYRQPHPAESRERPASCDRARRTGGALPADSDVGFGRGNRSRGPGSLAAPDTRPPDANGIHLNRRGNRVDRSDRTVGA